MKIHGRAIGETDYQTQYGIARTFFRVSDEAARNPMLGLKEEALESLIEREVLANAAEDMGLAATKTDAEDLVLDGHMIFLGDTISIPRASDDFNYDAFKNFVRQLGMSEAKYYEMQQRELLARTLRDLLRSSVSVSEVELRKNYDTSANQLSIRYARYEHATFVDFVDPSNEDITAWVKEHQEDLEKRRVSQKSRFEALPAQMRVSLIQVAKPTEPSDAEQAAGPEFAQQVAKAKAKIDAAHARLTGGEDFRTVARALSEHASARRGGDLGWAENTGTAAVDEALKTLEVDAVSTVITADRGWFVIKIDNKREGDLDEEAALRVLAEEALRDARAKDLAKAAATQDRDTVNGGRALTAVFAAPGLGGELGAIEDVLSPSPKGHRGKAAMEVTGLFSMSARSVPGLGLMPELLTQAWAATPDEEQDTLLETIFETGGAYIVAGLEKKELGSDEGYVEQRSTLYTAAWAQKSQRVLTKWAQRQCLTARGQGDIVLTEDKVQRLVTYNDKASDSEDEQDKPPTPKARPYVVCDRVGSQGRMFRMAQMMSFGGR